MNEQAKPAGRLPEVATELFEFSHGRRPGSYGAWAFASDKGASGRFFFGYYSKAKREAREAFRGHQIIYVFP